MYDETADPSILDVSYENANQAKSLTTNESLPNRLKRQLLQLKKETARLERLIELLEKNPDTNEILELLKR